MVTVHFRETPPTMVVIILLLIAAYAVYSGIEVLARTAAIFIFPILIPIAGVLLLSLIKMDYPLTALLPPQSLNKTLFGAVAQFANYSEMIVLTMLIPFIKTPLSARYFIIPITFTAVLIMILIFSLYVIFADIFNLYTYKFFQLFRTVMKAEVLFIFIWIITFFVKVSIFLFAVVKGVGDLFNIKNHTYIIAIAVLVLSTSAHVFSSYMEYMKFFVSYFVAFRIGIAVIIFTALMVIFIKGKFKAVI